MPSKFTEANISECQAKFKLSYHILYAYWCQQLVGFEGKDVLEVGGSLPKQFVFDYLTVNSWSAIESPDYEVALSEIGSSSQGSNLYNIDNYSELGFDNRKLGDYNLFAANIEDLPSSYYQKYDLIFSIAAFEHIHKFPLALEKMFLALKPGGQLFSVFSPIWSAHDGHHLPPITEPKQGKTFDFHNSPIPPWGHLMMKPPELCCYLYQFTDKETADLIAYYVYNSPHINRFFSEDYIDFINQSSFEVKHLELIGLVNIEQATQQRLERLYPGRTQFTNHGFLAILERQKNQVDQSNLWQVNNFSKQQTTNSDKTGVSKPIVKSNNSFNSSNARQSKPRIDVVLQATGTHGWSFSHGWAKVLQRQGLLNRVFTPVAEFAAEQPKYDDGLFEYLENPQADIILLLGFDWHSQPLHNTVKWQERWRKAPVKKIALLQECYSAEVVQSTPEWRQRMHQALTSTISCVDGLICHHEPDVEFLQKQENISLPIIFLPFYIDAEQFKNKLPFTQRKKSALFKGKAPQFFTERTYHERRVLIDILSRCKDVDLFELQDNLLFTNPLQAVEAYVNDLNSYQLQLNLPSLAPTLTVRPFEIMGCGGLLLQNKVIGDRSNELFQDWKHLVYYEPQNPEALLNKIEYLLENQDVAQKIAEQGYELCIEQHTIEHRLQAIISWINNNFDLENAAQNELGGTSWEPKANIVPRQNLETGKVIPTIIIDGVFFQLAQTGIARVWKSLLEEWVKNGFAKHILFLDREGTAPKISGIRYLTVPAYKYSNTDAERQILQQVCDQEGADLFISTYYTIPLSTPSVFLAHDMIPELIGWDLSYSEWREKHSCITHADAYIAVSKNTAYDLTRFFPDVSLESVTVAHNGVDSQIFSQASTEDINKFKTRYGIAKPYFILAGKRVSYKNAILFFKAFAQLYNKQEFDIVCTGSDLILEAEFRSYTLGSTVHMLQLGDEELSIAYSGAVALVYPSKYEGFGLPILEAFACGCPVITCPNGAIPEVAGEAALYVNDEDVDGLVNALCEVQKLSVRNASIAAGIKQAKKFSWSKMAETVSSALINATLLPLNLKDINFIIFPDWSQQEESLCCELEQVIRAIATQPSSSQITLLVDTENISEEDAALILSSVSMNLLMQEDLDVSEGLEISLVGQLGEMQWEALLTHVQARIVLENENQRVKATSKILQVAPEFAEVQKFLKQIERANSETLEKSQLSQSAFKVSAIVSTYNSEKFIRGCLQDLVEQTLYKKGELEIIVIDSASEQNEPAIVQEFQTKYPNIFYIRTLERETLYSAWNRGIQAARGQYITNANTDDRHRPDALEIMASYLDTHHETAIVYADQLITAVANDTWATTQADKRWNWPPFSYNELERRCIIGPQPMWRKSLHETYGYFRSEFASAGDYEFWLRIGKTEEIVRLPEILGLYYHNPHSLEHGSPTSQQETYCIWDQYGILQRRVIPTSSVPITISISELNQLPYRTDVQPLVSVIIPCYKHAIFLREAVESVINQTYQNWECIIVNDGSPDRTSEVAKHLIEIYKHKNIRLLEKPNSGVVESRNMGLEHSSGQFILFLDADDKIHPNFLEETREILIKYPTVGFVYTDIQQFGVKHDLESHGDFDPNRFLRNNQAPVTSLFRREIYTQVGGFKKVMDMGWEDWEFWISAYEKGWQGYRLRKPYLYYRQHASGSRQQNLNSSRSSQALLMAKIIKLHSKLYSQQEILWAEQILHQHNSPLAMGSTELNQRLQISAELQHIKYPLIDSVSQGIHRPKWSVIIPTYNPNLEYLEKTLRSVLEQDLGVDQMQIEVVDDRSTQNDPEELVKRIGQGRVSFYRHPKNLGLIGNWNACISRADGHLVHILHQDDVVKPGFYSRLEAAFEQEPTIGAAFCRYFYMDEKGCERDLSPLERETPGVIPNWIERIAVMQRIECPSIVVKREVYEKLGGFCREAHYAADWEMWKRIAAHYLVWYEPELLASYRSHSSSETSRLIKSGANTADTLKAIEISQSYLPVTIAAELSNQARENCAFKALNIARHLLSKGDVDAAIAQVREGIKSSQSSNTLVSVLELVQEIVRDSYQYNLLPIDALTLFLSAFQEPLQKQQAIALIENLKLRETNFIIFPDWSQPEDLLYQDLASAMTSLMNHPDINQITLLLDRGNLTEEEATLFVSGVVMNLVMEEGLDVADELEISLVGQLSEMQWEVLSSRINARIVLEHENKQAIAQSKIEKIPTYEIPSFSELTSVLT